MVHFSFLPRRRDQHLRAARAPAFANVLSAWAPWVDGDAVSDRHWNFPRDFEGSGLATPGTRRPVVDSCRREFDLFYLQGLDWTIAVFLSSPTGLFSDPRLREGIIACSV